MYWVRDAVPYVTFWAVMWKSKAFSVDIFSKRIVPGVGLTKEGWNLPPPEVGLLFWYTLLDDFLTTIMYMI